MKKAKIVKTNKKDEIVNVEEEYSLKKLIKIVLILVLVFAVFYFCTTTLVANPTKNTDTSNPVTIIDSSKITLNQLLDRSEEEYYVLATKESLYSGVVSKVDYTEIYNKYIKDYNKKEQSFYNVDLDDAFNKNYIGNEENITDNLNDLKLNDEVLFKINNGKIENYYIGSENIIKALSEL